MADITHIFPSAEQFDTMNSLLAVIAASSGGIFDVKDWASIKNIVRMGLGAKFFPVGYEFTTYDSDENTYIIWVVRAHNHHVAADGHLEHTMTIEMKYVYSTLSGTYRGVLYDAPEALYYAESGLEAGTYNFIWDYTDDAIVSGTYQFTLTQDIPAGGQIVINTNVNSNALTTCKISTYAGVGVTDAIESGVTITVGSGGTNLGTIQKDATSDEKLNCGQRILYGSNNYAQSAVDQWLNSSAAVGAVWTPQTVFDRPPTWAATYNGFMHGLPEDFLAVVQPAVIPCRTNSVYEVDSLDGTEFTPNQTYELTRKFFLLSRPEIFDSWDSASIKDGEVLEYYDGLTDTERIHRNTDGMACRSWLRSPVPQFTNHARVVYMDGTVYNGTARIANAVAAACIIA